MPKIGTCPAPGLHAHDAMVVQTILLDRHAITRAAAVTWLKAHGYRAVLDAKPNTWRARQIDPGCFKRTSFRTIRLNPQIEMVVGKLKA
ncbi:MAG: hypothetical protein ACLQVI_35590 [Polyangiaceae bacterium]